MSPALPPSSPPFNPFNIPPDLDEEFDEYPDWEIVDEEELEDEDE